MSQKILYLPRIVSQKSQTDQLKMILKRIDTPKSKFNKNEKKTAENSLMNQRKFSINNKQEFHFIPNLQKKNKRSINSRSIYQSSRLYKSFQKYKKQKNETDDIRQTDIPGQNSQLDHFEHKKISNNSFVGVIQNLKLMVPHKKDKNYSKFDSLIQQLKKINPFFNKLPSESAYLLLKIGKIITLQKNKIIYQNQSLSIFMYIILYGKVLLKDNKISFVKFSKTGESLAEQQIFTNYAQYSIKIKEQYKQKHIQTATAETETCLLRIKKKKYYELEHQMYQKGNHCKALFSQINNSLKIQYLFKNMIRNQAIDKRSNKCGRRFHTENYN